MIPFELVCGYSILPQNLRYGFFFYYCSFILQSAIDNIFNLLYGKILPPTIEVEYADKLLPRSSHRLRRGFVRAGVLFNDPILQVLQATDKLIPPGCRAGVPAEQSGCGYGRIGRSIPSGSRKVGCAVSCASYVAPFLSVPAWASRRARFAPP